MQTPESLPLHFHPPSHSQRQDRENGHRCQWWRRNSDRCFHLLASVARWAAISTSLQGISILDGADTEQIRAKILDELADLTAFRLNAEKFWVNCMATLKHIASVARAAALFNHKPHICDIQFDVVANDLNNRIVIKTRTIPPSKRTSFTSTTRSPESNFWMNRESRSCGNPTCSTPLSAAISPLQRPVCWRTASMARTPSKVI